MQVRLLLFAIYRDIAGTDQIDLELPPHSRAGDAITHFRASNPSFQRIPEHPVVAINLEYSSLDDVLNDGDELALLPPVAGG